MIRNRFFYLVAVLFSPMMIHAATNDPSQVPLSYSWNPYLGRVLLSGTATKQGIFGADGLLPVYGNRDGFGFADLMGDYATDNSFLVSPGGGYRKVLGNQIIGAYFFGDYEKVNLGPKFWELSPGMEWMNSRWDAHVNAYFPTDKSKQSGDTAFLDTFGNYSQVTFKTGTHNEYDALGTPYAVIGNGVDAEVGYSFQGVKHLRSRAYVGAYEYMPSSSVSSFTGVTAGFQEPLSKNISVAIENSYDKVSAYTIGVNLTLTFGGNSNIFSNDVNDRLLDPIDRHIGIIGTGAGTYAQQNLKVTHPGTLEYNNVYFLSPSGSTTHGIGLEDPSDIGAYGSPADLSQATLDEINALSPSGARIYLQGGAGAIYNINGTTAPSGYLLPYDGQDFYGRSADYTSLASSSELPELFVDSGAASGVFVILDNSENTFSNLYFSNPSNSAGYAILIGYGASGNQTINILNTTISGFRQGISLSNDLGSQTINLINSTIENTTGEGWVANNSGASFTANITNSILSHNSGDGFSLTNNTGSAAVNITNSTLDNNSGDAFSLTTAGATAININNSSFNNNSVGFAMSASAGSTNLTVTNSTFNSNSRGFSVADSGSSALNTSITNSEFNNNTGTVGFSVTNNSSGRIALSITGSQFNDNATTGFSLANQSSGAGITMSATNSEFNGNNTDGLSITNQSDTGLVNVTSLSDSRFSDNGQYGIAGTATYSDTTTINYSGANFLENGIADTSAHSGDHIDWISSVLHKV